MTVYYNEIDPNAIAWLRELMRRRLIAPGHIDTRSIADVMPSDLTGYTQCHFFAGVGVWAYACKLAEWPDEREVWTGSCPCTPFSVAGKGLGFNDPRDLWPDFFRLIRARRPSGVLGELTTGKAGHLWFNRAHADLEGSHYVSRALDIPACAVDAPQRRMRLWWLAVEHAAIERRGQGRTGSVLGRGRDSVAGTDAPGDVVNGQGERRREGRAERLVLGGGYTSVAQSNAPFNLGDTDGSGLSLGSGERSDSRPQRETLERADDHTVRSFYDGAEWLLCHDEKYRRTQPGTPMLVNGSPARIPMWRGLGNAIHARLAAEVVRAYRDIVQPPVAGDRGNVGTLGGL